VGHAADAARPANHGGGEKAAAHFRRYFRTPTMKYIRTLPEVFLKGFAVEANFLPAREE
jgi:hypothetical protein